MNFENLIKPDSVLCNVNARSKKHCLEILSELLTRSMPHIAKEDVFAKLIERERLGCTSLDKGIAFPHCRIAGLENSSAALIKLLEPVDFDAIDGDAVDLVFGLVVPEDLEKTDYDDIDVITSVLRDADIRTGLRAAATSSELFDALISGHADTAAGIQSAL